MRKFLWIPVAFLSGLGMTYSAYSAELVDANRLPPSFFSTPTSGTYSAPLAKKNPSTEQNVASPTDEFRVERSYSLPNGKKAIRFNQYHHNIMVWGQSVVSVSGGVRSLNAGTAPKPDLRGQVVQRIDTDLANLTPAFSAEQAIEQAKALSDKRYPTHDEKSQLVIRVNEQNKAQLVYLVSYVVDTPQIARPNFIINAKDGTIIKHWNGIAFEYASGPGGNQKIGYYEYGKNYGFLEVGDGCVMDNGKVRVVDMHSSTDESIVTAFHFSCPRNTVDQPVNGAFGVINDAYYFANATVKMYQEWLGTPPLKGKLNVRVHYGSHYENAFWDGANMNFGDGGSHFYPLVSADVTSHEISHGFTEQHANLIYEGQPGGINEAFSDMAGAALANYIKGSLTWKIGEDITKGLEPLRYMDYPSKDGTSIDNAKAFSDSLNVHNSSGVYNRAFYLLATTPGWNIRKAFVVFADANRLYWNPESNFISAACGVIHATRDRGYQEGAVVSAFKQVGITCTNS